MKVFDVKYLRQIQTKINASFIKRFGTQFWDTLDINRKVKVSRAYTVLRSSRFNRAGLFIGNALECREECDPYFIFNFCCGISLLNVFKLIFICYFTLWIFCLFFPSFLSPPRRMLPILSNYFSLTHNLTICISTAVDVALLNAETDKIC
jgi:hypothetical protein